MRYRRIRREGGTYFFTINLSDRSSLLLLDEIELLRQIINKVKKAHPFILDAMVVLPEHMHLLLTLPHSDNDYAKRLMLIKAGFSRQIPKTEKISAARQLKGERGIWQRRYWEHLIKDERDYEQHVNYIHYNPVKHGYVKQPRDWKYSTIHEFMRKDILAKGWAKYEKEEIINADDVGWGEAARDGGHASNAGAICRKA